MPESLNARFLEQLYDRSGRDETKSVTAMEIAAELELDDASLRTVTKYLQDEGLLKVDKALKGLPLSLTITQDGVKAVERENNDMP
jgi:Mn-dependent DtxR family transcriptional regulator